MTRLWDKGQPLMSASSASPPATITSSTIDS